MLKRITGLVILTTLLSLLAACGGAPAPGADTPAGQPAANAEPTAADAAAPADAAEPTPVPTTGQTSNYDSAASQITMWVFPNGPDPLGNTTARAEEFAQANPDIGVKVELVDWSIAYNQMQTALQGGADACVTQIGSTWVSGFHPIGGLRPFSAEEIASMGGEAAFAPAAWATTSMQGSDETIAIPWFMDVRALAYRSDMLEQAGLTPEQAFADFASFESTLETIKANNPDVAPFSHTGRGDWNVIQNASMFIWNYGGNILTPDNTRAAFNDAAAVEAVQFGASLFGKGLTPPDAPEINTVQAEARMGEGRVFSVVTGPWMIGNINNPAPGDTSWQDPAVRENIAFAEFPAGPGGRHTFVGGSHLSIFNECPNPEAALELVRFLIGTPAQVTYSRISGFLPATLEAQADEAFAGPAYEVFRNAAETGYVPPPIVQWGAVENTMKTALEGVWEDVAASPGTPIDAATVKARLDAAAQSVDELLAP